MAEIRDGKKRLNLMGSVSQTGYGVVAYNIFEGLHKRGWDVSLFLKGGTDRPKAEVDLIKEGVQRSQMFPYDAPCLNIWHQFDLANKVGRGKYVAYPFFELDCFNESEKHHLNYPDELIVSSEWALGVLHNNKVQTSKAHVVSPGVDLSIFNTDNIPERDDEKTIFLNAGKWEIRKGHDFLIDAFTQAFNKEDDVELWLMPTNKFLDATESRNWEKMYLDTPLGRAGKIKIIPWVNDHKEVAEVMALADCGVFPSRGEGWNLELLEMMAMGKQVIATNYSAHTEFCNENNCYLIDVDSVEPAYDGRWFFEQGNWATIGSKQILQLKDHMRFVYENKQKGFTITNGSGIQTAQKYSWELVCEKIDKILI